MAHGEWELLGKHQGRMDGLSLRRRDPDLNGPGRVGELLKGLLRVFQAWKPEEQGAVKGTCSSCVNKE